LAFDRLGVGEIRRFPKKKPAPISEEQEERELQEAMRAVSAPPKKSNAGDVGEEPDKRRAKRKRPGLRPQVDFSFNCLPDLWIEKLRGARYAATWKLAAHLLELDWKQYRKPFLEGEPIVLANGWLEANNLSRRDKGRGLREIVELGLVLVEFRARKSPIVTLIKPPPTE
jgi:hypothetical protein